MIGGIRLPDKKQSTLVTWTIQRPVPPAKVNLPLKNSNHSLTRPCVSLGQKVRVGETIATPATAQSVSLHASISGEITNISQAIEITSDTREEIAPSINKQERPGWRELSGQELSKIFRESGLVQLNASMKPLHLDLQSTCETLIVNGCESEPYMTSSHTLMMSHPLEILIGAEILRKFRGAKNIVIALEDDKGEAAELFKSKMFFLKWNHVEVKVFPSRFPQGLDMPLIRDALGIRDAALMDLQKESLPIYDAATSFSVYEAVVLQKPLYERVVTVGGECVLEPKNLWLRNGISLEKTIKICKGFLRPPRKIIKNGPMRGIEIKNLEESIDLGTEAILALPEEITRSEKVEPCIRCHECDEACPAEISPMMITLAAEKDLFGLARTWGSGLCIECGNCTYVCPSKRPMLELIRYADTHSGRRMDL